MNVTVKADGALVIDYQTTFFPSIGFSVTRNAGAPLTDVMNDASCLSNDAVLGLSGLALLTRALLNFNNKGSATVLPGATGYASHRDGLLC
jgi:hypothetical protein